MPQAATARRLTVGLVAVLLLLAAAAVFIEHALASAQDRMQERAQADRRKQRSALEMREHVHELAAATRDLVMENDLARMRPLADRIAAERASYENCEATLGMLVADRAGGAAPERVLLQQIRTDESHAWPALTRVIALGAVNDDTHATALFVAAKPAIAGWLQGLTRLDALEEQRVQQAASDARAARARAVGWLMALCGLALLVSLVAGWWAVRRRL